MHKKKKNVTKTTKSVTKACIRKDPITQVIDYQKIDHLRVSIFTDPHQSKSLIIKHLGAHQPEYTYIDRIIIFQFYLANH